MWQKSRPRPEVGPRGKEGTMMMEPMTDQETDDWFRGLKAFLEQEARTPPCRAVYAARAVLALLGEGPRPSGEEFTALVALIGEERQRTKHSALTDG